MDLRLVGAGLSDRDCLASVVMPNMHSFGGARLVQDGFGLVRVYCADDLLLLARFDLIKIDVQGMELQVIAGAAVMSSVSSNDTNITLGQVEGLRQPSSQAAVLTLVQ